jgi:starch-binding outer membrane protein, SusD/RagB family
MKKIIYSIFSALLLANGLMSCGITTTEEVISPNNASLSSVTSNATKGQLDALAIGQIGRARDGVDTYHQVVGTAGKELFNFNSTENRWMTELNGTKPLDNSNFYGGATTAFGPAVRQANTLIAAVANTKSVTAQEASAYQGLANTFKGLAYLYQLNVQYTNGVRLNVEDPLKPSKFATYEESLAGIKKFLDDGAAQLDAAGAAFPFAMPATYAGFNTPATFKKFNRAIALRVAIYQKDWAGAAALLPQTFLSETGSLTTGPSHSFNPTNPDVGNPMINTSSVRIVGVEKLWNDAEAGDLRLTNKVKVVSPSISFTNGVVYATKYLANMYNSASSPVPIIRNEELILIAAEVAAQQGKTADATKYINIVRTAAGLQNYAGATDQNSLINAILKERVYSLWYEGHRWVDMRRYGKLGEIALPVTGMTIYDKLLRPLAEVNWDIANP